MFIDNTQVGISQAIDASGLDNWNLGTNDLIDIGIMGFSEGSTLSSNYLTVDNAVVNIYNTNTATPEVLTEEAGISIFPNPVQNDLQFIVESGSFEVKIIDAKSSVYQALTINDSHALNVRQLPTGLYFLELTDVSNGKRYIEKVFKQ